MPVYKKNKKWYAVISYVGLNQKYRKAQSKYFDTKKEAIQAEIALRQKFKVTERYSITFEEAYIEYIEQKKMELKPQSIRKNDELFRHIEPLYKIRIENLTQQQFKVFRDEIDKKDIGATQKNRIIRLVCRIVDYANQVYGIYNDVPKRCPRFISREVKKEMMFFTLDEFNRFIKCEDDIVFKTLFSLLFYNGLRIGEALALNWTDFANNQININKTLVTKVRNTKPFTSTPKTKGSIRRLPLNSTVRSLLDELRAYYSRFPGFNEQWYIFGGIAPLSETTITNRKNDLCRKANVKQIRIHDFRHSCASYYIQEKNAPIILVSKLLGHTKISMTLDTYSHFYPNELDKLMKD